MTKTTLISEMQKFSFGNKIVCSDGDDGVLMSVIFDASARRLTHIGVKQGRLFGKTVYVPYESVTSATGEGVTLNIKRADVSAAPATPPQGALLDHKSIVENTASAARGTLLLIAIHPESGILAYLVAHHLRPGQDTLLREEFVTALAPDTVRVNVPAATLDALPPYRPDSVLQQEVEAILYDITPMHIDLPGMTIRVLDGVLYLDGNISSSLRGDIAQDQVLGVAGLLEIKNNLIGDDRLASDLAMTLAQDPRTRDLPIGVYPRLGTVRLSGAVHNAQQKAAAGEIVRNFPGVRGVINDLVVNPKTDLLYVMARPEGGEAEDIVPGKYIRHTK
jgi:osmotically-inducible protein OsmY